jgi:hypothetical protein
VTVVVQPSRVYVGANLDEQAKGFWAVVISADLDQESLGPGAHPPQSRLERRPPLDEQGHDGKTRWRHGTAFEARLSKTRGQGRKYDGRHVWVKGFLGPPPRRVVPLCLEVGLVSQRSVDEVGVCVEEPTALFEILGEDGIDEGGSRRAPVRRVADQGVVPAVQRGDGAVLRTR